MFETLIHILFFVFHQLRPTLYLSHISPCWIHPSSLKLRSAPGLPIQLLLLLPLLLPFFFFFFPLELELLGMHGEE